MWKVADSQSSSSNAPPAVLGADLSHEAMVVLGNMRRPGSMRTKPCRRGYLPVKVEPKLVQVNGACVWWFSNSTPSRANRSMWGERTRASP